MHLPGRKTKRLRPELPLSLTAKKVDNSQPFLTHEINLDLFIAGNTVLKKRRFLNLFSHQQPAHIFYYDFLCLDIKLFLGEEMTNWRDNSLCVMPYPQPLNSHIVFNEAARLDTSIINNTESILNMVKKDTLSFYFFLSQILKQVYGNHFLIFQSDSHYPFFTDYYAKFTTFSLFVQSASYTIEQFESYMTHWENFPEWKCYQAISAKWQAETQQVDSSIKNINHAYKYSENIIIHHLEKEKNSSSLDKNKFESTYFYSKKKFDKNRYHQQKLKEKNHTSFFQRKQQTIPDFHSVYTAQCLTLFSDIKQTQTLNITFEKKIEKTIQLFHTISTYGIEALHDNLAYFDQLLSLQLTSLVLSKKIPHLAFENEVMLMFDKIHLELESFNEQFLNTLIQEQDNQALILKTTLKDRFKF
jgi:hypothetical protein